MYRIERTDREIDDLYDKICEQVNKGGSKYFRMTYEEGLREMFHWLTEKETDGSPLE